MVEAAQAPQARHPGRHPPPLLADVPGGGGVRAQRRHGQGHRRARLPHPERVAQGHRQSARRATRPPGFDWEAWLGPAPKVPYNRNRAFYRFRWFYDYSGGQVTNFGVHYLDFIHWALGQDAPLAVTAMGGKFAARGQPRDPRHPGGALALSRRHAGHLLAVQRQRRPGRAARLRNRVSRHQGHALPRSGTARKSCRRRSRTRVPGPLAPRPHAQPATTHGRKPLIEPRKVDRRAPTPPCTPATSSTASRAGRRATATSRSAIAAPPPRSSPTSRIKTKSYLEWDAKAEKFTNHPAANKLLDYHYRAAYRHG